MLWFVCTLTLCATLMGTVGRRVELLAHAWIDPVPAVDDPENWFLDHAIGLSALAHETFYFGLGGVAEQMRQADVLVLGNSRAIRPFTIDLLETQDRDRGIRVFNMGMAHRESVVMHQSVMERHNLRPTIVVANADVFFRPVPSLKARSMLVEDPWDYTKTRFEEQAKFQYHRHARRFLPHLLPMIPLPPREAIPNAKTLHRSIIYGSQRGWPPPRRTWPVKPDAGRKDIQDAEWEAAKDFRDFLESRGGSLVLTLVPSAQLYSSRERAAELAEGLGVPFIAPELDGLVTRDESHLDPESARRFGEAFLEALLQDETVRDRMGLD